MELNEEYKIDKDQLQELKSMQITLRYTYNSLKNIHQSCLYNDSDDIDGIIADIEDILIDLKPSVREYDNLFESIERKKIVDDIIELNKLID